METKSLYPEIKYESKNLISKKELKQNILTDYPELSDKIISCEIEPLDENLFLEKLEEFCRYCQIPLPYTKHELETYTYKDFKYMSLNKIVNEYQEYRETGEPCGNRLYLRYNDNVLSINHTENDGCGPFEVLDYELLCTMKEFAELMVEYLTYKQLFDYKGIYVSFRM